MLSVADMRNTSTPARATAWSRFASRCRNSSRVMPAIVHPRIVSPDLLNHLPRSLFSETTCRSWPGSPFHMRRPRFSRPHEPIGEDALAGRAVVFGGVHAAVIYEAGELVPVKVQQTEDAAEIIARMVA